VQKKIAIVATMAETVAMGEAYAVIMNPYCLTRLFTCMEDACAWVNASA